MPFAISAQITGLEETMRRLRDVDARVRRKALRRGTAKAASIVNKAIKAACPKDSGLLKKSIGTKVKTYRNSGVVVAVIGPRKGFKQAVESTKYTDHDGNQITLKRVENPVNIAHLVEGGRKAVKATDKKMLSTGKGGLVIGPEAKAVPGVRFMAKGFAQAKGAARQAMIDAIEEELRKA